MKKIILCFALLTTLLASAQSKGFVIIVNDTVVASSNSIFPNGGSGGASEWGQLGGTLTNQTDLVTELARYGLIGSNNSWTGTNTFNGTSIFSNDVTFGNPLTVNNIFTSTGTYAEVNRLYFGKTGTPTGRRWGLETTAFGASITLESAEDSGIFGTLYTFNSTGQPANAEDVATKSYVDNASSNATVADGSFGDLTVASGNFTLNADAVSQNEIATGGVSTDEILDGSILNADLNGISGASQGDYLTINGTGFAAQTGLLDNSVTAATIVNGSVSEADLQISNNPFSNAVLGFDGTDGFQWVTQSGGGGTFDTADDYTLTGAWNFDGNVTFSQGLTVDGGTLSIPEPTTASEPTTKNYVDSAIAAVGSPNTNAGQKVFTTIDGSTTPTYTIGATDFAPGGADEGKLRFMIVQDTVEFTLPQITSTTKSLFIKGDLNAKATFKASSGQLFWIANEDSYVNSFEFDNMNAAAITPISSTLYSIEGNVRGFNDDTTGPTAVTDLAASNIQTNSVRLNWTHATDDNAVASYEISTDGTNFNNIGFLNQYDLLGLTASTAYTVTIRAIDNSNNQGATATVNFTTSATFTLVTDANTNTNIFSSGSGSNVANDTGLYDSGIGDHLAPVNVQSQSAVATTVNGYTHANRVVSDGTQFSRVRPRFTGVTTQGNVYEWDFIYRMTDGGQYGAVNVDGTSVTGLNATDWTVVSGESTAGGTTLDVEVYASNNAAANAGEAIEWILVVKEKETVVDFTIYQPLTASNPNPQIIDEGSAAFPPDEENTTNYDGTNLHNTALRATITNVANTDLGTSFVTQVESTATNTSQARLEFDNPNTGTQVFQYDFTYRMLQGTDGRLRIQGFDVDISNLAATEWTTISGEFTGVSNNVTVNVYSDNGAGNIGDTIQFKLSLKLKDD